MINLFIYSLGLVVGLIAPILWGRLGGDEGIKKRRNNPKLGLLLKFLHHWEIGLIVLFLSLCVPYPYNIFMLGWSVSTTLDDLLFHSFEYYFERKYKT